MAVSQRLFDAHVDDWQRVLSVGNHTYRRVWPPRLFRHEPIGNAAAILSSGALLSRAAALRTRVLQDDVAPAEIVDATDRGHAYVRLYWRPRTPTQYHVEGIRKPHEVYREKHAPVLVILIFSASTVLTRDDVSFSNGNLQSPESDVLSGDEGFATMPFADIFHEGPFDPTDRDRIVRRRCAEVLVPDRLPLADTVQAVLCRSSAERAFLLHRLGSAARAWSDRIRVFSKPGVFQNDYAYIESVTAASTGISFAFHPRRDGASVRTELTVRSETGTIVCKRGPRDLDGGRRWRVDHPLADGRYTITINVDGCPAHEAVHVVDSLPF